MDRFAGGFSRVGNRRHLFQPGFFDEVVMREFVGRFGETIHRPQPLYFYLPHLLHKFAPWSVLMIGIAVFDLAIAKLEIALCVSRNVAGNFLAALLEHWWADRDVADSIKARR